jgi:hypothetical protein
MADKRGDRWRGSARGGVCENIDGLQATISILALCRISPRNSPSTFRCTKVAPECTQRVINAHIRKARLHHPAAPASYILALLQHGFGPLCCLKVSPRLGPGRYYREGDDWAMPCSYWYGGAESLKENLRFRPLCQRALKLAPTVWIVGKSGSIATTPASLGIKVMVGALPPSSFNA